MAIEDRDDVNIRHIRSVPENSTSVSTERFASGSRKGLTISLVAYKEVQGAVGYAPVKIKNKAHHRQLVLVMSRADAADLCSRICTALKAPLRITEEQWDKHYK